MEKRQWGAWKYMRCVLTVIMLEMKQSTHRNVLHKTQYDNEQYLVANE